MGKIDRPGGTFINSQASCQAAKEVKRQKLLQNLEICITCHFDKLNAEDHVTASQPFVVRNRFSLNIRLFLSLQPYHCVCVEWVV